MTKEILGLKTCKIRQLASYIGSLVSVCSAVEYGMLHTKILERTKFLALVNAGEDFEARMNLPVSIREDLVWWKNIFSDNLQCNFIKSGNFSLEIFTDALLTGWGAVCEGFRTYGFWYFLILVLQKTKLIILII